jgi:hypothetical protein
MDKSQYLEQLKQENSSDKAAEQATNNYWLESKAVNEVFQLCETNGAIPLDLYIYWKELNSKSWVELCERLKMDLNAKRILLDLCDSDRSISFDDDIWSATITECLKDKNHDRDSIATVFQYQHLLNQQEIDRKIGPVRDLLTELEQIVGNECFNINKAEPWRRWGVLDPTCERLRYPITFETSSERVIKTHTVPADVSNTDFISGKYVFGGNQLDVFRGLYKVLIHLKNKGLLNDSVVL